MNKTIWAVLGAVGVILLALIVFLGVSFPKTPETVSQAEFQSYKGEAKEEFGKTNSRIEAMADSVRTLAGTMNTGFGQIRDELNDLEKDQEKESEVQAVKDELNAEKAGRQIDALKAKDAELEKDLAEVQNKGKDRGRCPGSRDGESSYSSSIYIERTGSIWIEKSDYYEFRIAPNVEIFVDGRGVLSSEIVYLTQGRHTCRSHEPVTISWRLD